MILLTKGQPLIDNPNLVVYDSTGYYDDGSSVICALTTSPEEPVCRYEAKYVLYGAMVYSISNPEELMAEILKIDPASLFGKDSQQIAVEKMIEKIVPQEPGQPVEEATTEAVDLTDTLNDEPPSTDHSVEANSEEIIDTTSTTTPDTIIPEPVSLDNTSTTSPSDLIETPTSAVPITETLNENLISTTTDSTN